MRTRHLSRFLGRFLVLFVFAAIALAASPALAKHVRFLGPHPISARYGGGYCYIEAPHIHAYAPDRPALYQEVDGEFVFTGDPSPFGYDGPRYTFYGHHPVVGAPGGVYCYIDGPHVHDYAPPETPDYRMQNGVAFYVGNFPPVYYKERPHRERVMQTEYRPYVALRPTVQVTPPPEWHGEVWVAPPSVEVSAPGVVVNAPPPPSVEVSAPGVVVAPPVPGVVVAPPSPVVVAPPAPHVFVPGPHVYAPRPHVGVFVGAPAPVVVAPAPVVVGAPAPVYVEGHGKFKGWHHDNGKHKGWYK